MRTTADYLDALRIRFDVPSDYALGRHTGWHRQHISRYRRLKSSFDDQTAMKVADWLGIPPAGVLVDMQAQRAAQNPALVKLWAEIGAKIAAGIAGLFLGALIFGETSNLLSAFAFAVRADVLYVLCQVAFAVALWRAAESDSHRIA